MRQAVAEGLLLNQLVTRFAKDVLDVCLQKHLSEVDVEVVNLVLLVVGGVRLGFLTIVIRYASLKLKLDLVVRYCLLGIARLLD